MPTGAFFRWPRSVTMSKVPSRLKSATWIEGMKDPAPGTAGKETGRVLATLGTVVPLPGMQTTLDCTAGPAVLSLATT